MKRRLRNLLLGFLLAWFPVQTMALPAVAMVCMQHEGGGLAAAETGPAHGHDHAHAQGQGHDHGQAHVQASEGSAQDPGFKQDGHALGHSAGLGGDSCCDHHFTGMLLSMPRLPDGMVPAQVPATPEFPRLFVPEQPIHPPSS